MAAASSEAGLAARRGLRAVRLLSALGGDAPAALLPWLLRELPVDLDPPRLAAALAPLPAAALANGEVRAALRDRGAQGELVARMLDVAADRQARGTALAGLPLGERLQMARFLLTPCWFASV